LLCSDDDTTNHICTFLYSCNNIILQMAAIAAETCWWGNCE